MRFGFCGGGAVLGMICALSFVFQGCTYNSVRLVLTDAKISMPEPAHVTGSARNLPDGGNTAVSAMYEAWAQGSIHSYSVNDDSINARFRAPGGVLGGNFDYAHKNGNFAFFTGGGIRSLSWSGYFGVGMNTDNFELGSALSIDVIRAKVAYDGYAEDTNLDFNDGSLGTSTRRDSFEISQNYFLGYGGISLFASGYWNDIALTYALTISDGGGINSVTYKGEDFEMDVDVPAFLIHDFGISYTYDKKLQVRLGASRYSVFGTGGQIYSVTGRVAYLW